MVLFVNISSIFFLFLLIVWKKNSPLLFIWLLAFAVLFFLAALFNFSKNGNTFPDGAGIGISGEHK